MLDAALKQVKRDKAAFANLVKEGERLREAGNVLGDAANKERLTADEQTLEVLARLATRAGPVSDALTAAARDLKAGRVQRGQAARAFLRDVEGRNLVGLERGPGAGEPVAGDAGPPDRPAAAGEQGEAPEALGPEPNQRALFQGPAIKLTGRELGDFGGDLKALRDAALDWYRQSLQAGPPALSRDIGAVHFTGKGRNKLKGSSADPRTLKMVVALRDIIERGDYRGKEALRKPRSDGAVAFHWFEADVELDGRSLRAGVAVLEDAAGNKFYNLNADLVEWRARNREKQAARGDPRTQTRGREPTKSAGEPDTLEQPSIPESDGINITLLGEAGAESAAAPRAGVELADDLARIWLTERADPSSIIHESGHVFLALLRRLALGLDGVGAPAGAARDWSTVRAWLGADDTSPLTRAQHEQWAGAFERYVAEGRAPSAELLPVFDRFKRWLLDIYRALARIAPEIPDDVRQVMDRMLATDRQLADARAAGPTAPPGHPFTGRPPDAAPPFDARAESIDQLAETMGLDTGEAGAGAIDPRLAQLDAAGRLTEAERAALDDADQLAVQAEAYGRAYEAAAVCLSARP